jgi:hypothetical protein
VFQAGADAEKAKPGVDGRAADGTRGPGVGGSAGGMPVPPDTAVAVAVVIAVSALASVR